MRKLSILKTLVDLAFFFSAIVALGVIILLPMIVFGYADDIPVTVNGQELIAKDWQTKLLIVFVAISSFFFFYAIFLFRKCIAFFHKRDIFNENVIRYFNTIGKCLVASSLLVTIPAMLYYMIHRNHVGITFQTGFDTPLLAISLGLFFMVLSEVFKIAKNLKEENDLTL